MARSKKRPKHLVYRSITELARILDDRFFRSDTGHFVFLSLDLGTRTGFCFWKVSDTNSNDILDLELGCIDLRLKDKWASHATRIVNFAQFLLLSQPDMIVYEYPAYTSAGRNISRILSGLDFLVALKSCLASYCENFCIPVYRVLAGELKSMTGNRRASKLQVLQFVKHQIKSCGISDNITYDSADAFCAAMWLNQQWKKWQDIYDSRQRSTPTDDSSDSTTDSSRSWFSIAKSGIREFFASLESRISENQKGHRKC